MLLLLRNLSRGVRRRWWLGGLALSKARRGYNLEANLNTIINQLIAPPPTASSSPEDESSASAAARNGVLGGGEEVAAPRAAVTVAAGH